MPSFHVEEIHATIWEHLAELRRVTLLTLACMGMGFVLCLSFHQQIIEILLSPISKSTEHSSEQSSLRLIDLQPRRVYNPAHVDLLYTLPLGSDILPTTTLTEVSNRTYLIPSGGHLMIVTQKPATELALLSPLEGIKTALNLSFWLGIVATSPLWCFLLIQFIAPALKRDLQRLLCPFCLLSLCFLSAGLLFGYSITLPIANRYLYEFNGAIGLNLWSFATYIDFTLVLLFANSLAFELCLVLFSLVHIGVLKPAAMRAKRRYAILIAFIIGAVLTPPDVLTQLLLAVPLIAFYELAILYATLLHRKTEHLSIEARGP